MPSTAVKSIMLLAIYGNEAPWLPATGHLSLESAQQHIRCVCVASGFVAHGEVSPLVPQRKVEVALNLDGAPTTLGKAIEQLRTALRPKTSPRT